MVVKGPNTRMTLIYVSDTFWVLPSLCTKTLVVAAKTDVYIPIRIRQPPKVYDEFSIVGKNQPPYLPLWLQEIANGCLHILEDSL